MLSEKRFVKSLIKNFNLKFPLMAGWKLQTSGVSQGEVNHTSRIVRNIHGKAQALLKSLNQCYVALSK